MPDFATHYRRATGYPLDPLVAKVLAEAPPEVLAALPGVRATISGYLRELHAAEQILGKALGYPPLDHTVCPSCDPGGGCTCGEPQVCVGEHTVPSLAAEAAERIEAAERMEREAVLAYLRGQAQASDDDGEPAEVYVLTAAAVEIERAAHRQPREAS